MHDRLDPLIEERAPWLFASRPGTRFVRRLLNRALSYDKTVAIATELEHAPTKVIMDRMGDMLARDLQVSGLQHIPRHGAALIVANHPTGIADGIMLWQMLRDVRPDQPYFMANRDICRFMPQLEDMIAPVEWREEKRSREKTRETLIFMKEAVAQGRLGVIFPSGRLAKRRGLRLHERPWMASAAQLARRFDVPIIPVNIRARNSWLFYLFDLLHPTLRDITLFHETLNKTHQPYRITVGEPISPAALPKSGEDAIAVLRKATLALGENGDPTVSIVRATRRPLLRF